MSLSDLLILNSFYFIIIFLVGTGVAFAGVPAPVVDSYSHAPVNKGPCAAFIVSICLPPLPSQCLKVHDMG